jgi:hypothetical protein
MRVLFKFDPNTGAAIQFDHGDEIIVIPNDSQFKKPISDTDIRRVMTIANDNIDNLDKDEARQLAVKLACEIRHVIKELPRFGDAPAIALDERWRDKLAQVDEIVDLMEWMNTYPDPTEGNPPRHNNG